MQNGCLTDSKVGRQRAENQNKMGAWREALKQSRSCKVCSVRYIMLLRNNASGLDVFLFMLPGWKSSLRAAFQRNL
jgi:hypothetical protein